MLEEILPWNSAFRVSSVTTLFISALEASSRLGSWESRSVYVDIVHGDGKGGRKFGFDCDGWICTPPEIVAIQNTTVDSGRQLRLWRKSHSSKLCKTIEKVIFYNHMAFLQSLIPRPNINSTCHPSCRLSCPPFCSRRGFFRPWVVQFPDLWHWVQNLLPLYPWKLYQQAC